MCGRLVNLDTVARVLAEYYHLKTETQLAALDEALSKVPAVSVGGGHGKDHVADPNKMVGDLISRQAAIDALLGITAMRNTIPLDSAIFNIKKLPSAQPEIIRCKDCKWWDREAEDSPMGYCHACKHNHYSRHWEIRIIRTYKENFFCADAEPKEEGKEDE